MSAASSVLLDPSLLREIVAFQSGFPLDIKLWARSIRSPYPDKNLSLLVRRAARQHDLRLLQRLWQLRSEQPALLERYCMTLSVEGLWEEMLRSSSVAVAEWITSQPDLMRRFKTSYIAARFKASDIDLALQNENRSAMLVWLLTTFPSRKALVSVAHTLTVASCGDVELMQWLEANVPNLPVSDRAIDAAAESGKLEMVKYLHDHRSERGTAALTEAVKNGHAHVVEYLHENGLAEDYEGALRTAAERGYLNILQYLMDRRPQCSSPSMLCRAARAGRLEVVQYLHRHYHHYLCSSDAIVDAIDASRMTVIMYLSEHCDKVNGSALFHAVKRGELNALEYLVTTRTEGCLVKAYAIARGSSDRYMSAHMARFLQWFIDPSICHRHHDVDECNAGTRRTCQRWLEVEDSDLS